MNDTKPKIGMIVAFKESASSALAGIPATIRDIWPRFRSGDYLVTLKYDRPVKVKGEFITCIDAFMRELDVLQDA